jgi:hypothetical protein
MFGGIFRILDVGGDLVVSGVGEASIAIIVAIGSPHRRHLKQPPPSRSAE